MGNLCRYELVVFDWDGTLMDSTGLIAECIGLAAADLGFPVPSVDAAKEVIGLGLLASTQRLFPQLGDADRLQFAARYRYHYVPRDHEAKLYAGVPELLKGLCRPERFLAVATGKPRAGLERAFAYSGLKSFFHFSRCADEGFTKPHPDMLLY
ncbi:MAG: HAD hydrolase-like protein, partial [Betaproteobacteria bacterium]|nr:HAD hydrolase-like protein [Betaproteobacteria bacterium]